VALKAGLDQNLLLLRTSTKGEHASLGTMEPSGLSKVLLGIQC
jgi:hypothetical protein